MVIENGVLIKVDDSEIINGRFEIPEGVTSIGDSAFKWCDSLTEIKIPEGVTSIGDSAFEWCDSLTEIKIPEGVTSIGDSAFARCKGLKKIKISEGVTSIGNGAFKGCSSLTEIKIPEGVTSIGNGTFGSCSSLTEIKIPEGVTSIGYTTFLGCSNLEKVNIPEGVISIGDSAFSGCESLTEIKLPEGVTSIGDGAFSGCESLTEIKLPEGVISIGDSAFFGCESLTEIKLPEGVTSIGDGAFFDCSSLTEIKHERLERFFNEHNIKNDLKANARKLVTSQILSSDFAEQQDALINRLSLWINKDFVPMKSLFDKIPEDKIETFDKKVWFKLAKESVFNISEETKMALAELAYTFGVFEKDIVEVRGNGKVASEVTSGDKRNGNVEDYQKRISRILDMVHSGKLTNENLHTMFDGTNMEFNPAFYRFFIDNQEEIFNDSELMESIPKIQKDMNKIMAKFGGYIPTVQECKKYFADITYERVEPGNQSLAELCKLCGVTQEKFEGYQEIYSEQKKRKESSIPNLSGSNYRILDLNDPRTLLIGEGRFSKCCQKLGGAGEACMKHSAKSQNGRIIEITDDDGTLIAQSWMWRNGNVLCFDSIEAKAIEDKKYSDADRKRLIDKIESEYREAASDLISESEKKVEEYRKKKQKEIEQMEVSESEREKMLETLDRVCEDSKIKRVTVGKGYWPISQKITERFSSKEVDTSNGRVSPRESIDYLNDSDIQYVVAEVEDVQTLRTNDAKVEVTYRDKRRIEKEEGENILEDTIERIKRIEQEAHKKEMQLMKNIIDASGLADIYGTYPENLRVICGEDWYYVYSNEANEIHVHDLARGKLRFEDEKAIGSAEMGKGFDEIVMESMKENKPIGAELREDTSYILMLEMMERGLIRQIGDDVAFEFSGGRSPNDEYGWDDDYGRNSQSEERTITSEEQKDILARKEEIRKLGPTEEHTTMHRLTFEPTERYKEILRRREARKAKEQVKADKENNTSEGGDIG